MDGPYLEIIASFRCCGKNVGEMWISGIGLRQTEISVQDCRGMFGEACYLVRVGVGGSDDSHKADLYFHANSKKPSVLATSTVLIMGIGKCRLRKNTWVIKSCRTWFFRGSTVGLSPKKKKKKHIVLKRAFVVTRKRVGFVRASNPTHFLIILSVKSVSQAKSIAQDSKNTNSERRTGSTRDKFHVVYGVNNSTTTDRSRTSATEGRKADGVGSHKIKTKTSYRADSKNAKKVWRCTDAQLCTEGHGSQP